jgi:hypothetical protein
MDTLIFGKNPSIYYSKFTSCMVIKLMVEIFLKNGTMVAVKVNKKR